MSKIAVITDTHNGARGDLPAFANYFGKFYKNIFFPYLREHNIKKVIHLGDITDRRKFIGFESARRTQPLAGLAETNFRRRHRGRLAPS